MNPENGICLSALYDKAFDKGLITISPDDYRICLSSALYEYERYDYFEEYFDVFTMCIPELLNIDKVKLSRLFNTLKITPNNLVLKLAVLFSLNVTQDFIQFSNRMILDKKTTRLVKLTAQSAIGLL